MPGYPKIRLVGCTCLAWLEQGSLRASPLSLPINVHLHPYQKQEKHKLYSKLHSKPHWKPELMLVHANTWAQQQPCQWSACGCPCTGATTATRAPQTPTGHTHPAHPSCTDPFWGEPVPELRPPLSLPAQVSRMAGWAQLYLSFTCSCICLLHK